MSGLILGGAGPGPAQEPDDRARERIRELRDEIARHDELYFKQASPEITDAEYDRLKRELRSLEAAHPAWAGPAETIADDRSGRFPVHRHRERMLSLDKAYTEKEWRAFHARLVRQLGRSELDFVVEPKYDGLAISLTYERGVLVRAATRGNGREGDDVTVNARAITGLPGELAGAGFPDRVELRGEVYLAYAEFARLNAEREAAGEEPFAHPRNLATGTLRSADPAERMDRELSVVVYGWGAWEGGAAPVSQQAFHAQVRAWGLPGVADFRVARTADEAWAAVQALGRARAKLGFLIDGAVVKLDDTALRTRAGADDRAPLWAVACKYEPERAVTQLRAITIQVGRTGVLTPVAEFDPVGLGGATVSRATLHNRAEIARRDIRVGDFIEVEKAGEIIPAVVGVQREQRPAGAQPYLFPDRCPACDTPVAAVPGDAMVRCPNAGCPAQRQRRLEHFASAQAVDINGLGPATIAALIGGRLVQSPVDFYRLKRGDLQHVDGIAGKTADRLLAEIERSKKAELWRFIHGLGIPRVGAATARELAALGGDLAGFSRLEKDRLAGRIGPAAAAEVTEFLARAENQAELRGLLAAGVDPRTPTPAVGTPDLRGKVFVLTGRLPTFTRVEAMRRIVAAGGRVSETVNGKTDFVVAGEGAGAKLARARELGVPVLDEAALLKILPE